MKRRGAGRPTLPDGEAKDVVIALRITKNEMDEIGAAAARSGTTVARWARGALVTAASMQHTGSPKVG